MTSAPAQRGCSMYRITVWNPHDDYRSKWLGYLGETERLPIERLAEHLKARYPWGDTVAAIEVDDQVWPGKLAVLAAEESAVRAERPLYNREYNGGNPWAIPHEVQVAQRHARDSAAGRPLWQPGQRQMRRSRAARPAPPAWWHRSRWTGWHVLTPAWLVLSLLAWGYVHGPWDEVAVSAARPQLVGWSLLPSAVLAAWVVGWGWRSGARQSRRRRRK